MDKNKLIVSVLIALSYFGIGLLSCYAMMFNPIIMFIIFGIILFVCLVSWIYGKL